MLRFAQTCAAVAATPGKIEKVALVAAYLRAAEPADLEPATRFFTGAPLPPGSRALAIGGRTIVAAAEATWGIDERELSAAYRRHGDLGAALGELYRPPLDLGLFRESLTPARLASRLEEIAAVAGRAANRRRLVLCERILSTLRSPLETTYVVKILTGELRIGLREGLVLDALAAAFCAPPEDVRRAAAASGDPGVVARHARAGTLAELAAGYGAPVAFMLATPIPYGEYAELAGSEWLVEDKYDGIRMQVQKDGAAVRLFSRTLNDSARAYPEIVAAVREREGDFILDGELIAEREGRVLPFRYLQSRLQRKEVSPELQAEVPVAFVAFDLLARGREVMIELPLAERRARLEALLPAAGTLRTAPAARLAPDANPERIEALFAAAREAGNEGLLLKNPASRYAPGRRGKWWRKLKRELSTLDAVVVAVEWGHGKRAQVLSDYTFAVRGADGELLTIGKAYSGLTDAEIAEMTQWFLAHPLNGARRSGAQERAGLIAVEPEIVIEVAFDVIQRSTLHESGYALRFPRIVRLRPDKPASEADTVERVEEIYAAMLAREGVAR